MAEYGDILFGFKNPPLAFLNLLLLVVVVFLLVLLFLLLETFLTLLTGLESWASLLLFGESKYETIDFFLNSFVGKFIILSLTWSFLFQILSEIRHLIMDLGYGFELQTTKITGLIVIFGSIILTIIFYLIGKTFI